MDKNMDLPEEEAREIIKRMIVVEEDQLYAWLGEALEAKEVKAYSRNPQTAINESLSFMNEKLNSLEKRKKTEAKFILPKPLIDKAKKFIKDNIKKLKELICEKGNACEWGNDLFENFKKLLKILLTALGEYLGINLSGDAITTIVIIIMKMGIRIFCNCKNDVS
jgi:hydroxymethylpyrimidine pyrophosphatase-like HAD family hydrolase